MDKSHEELTYQKQRLEAYMHANPLSSFNRVQHSCSGSQSKTVVLAINALFGSD